MNPINAKATAISRAPLASVSIHHRPSTTVAMPGRRSPGAVTSHGARTATPGTAPARISRLGAEDLAEHRRHLHSYAVGQLKDDALAEDVVQETLIAAMDAIDRFSGHSSVRTWLISILRHKILDAYRQQARDPVSLDALNASNDDEGASSQGDDAFPAELSQTTDSYARDPQAVIAEQALWQRFEHHLEHLPARTARAFVLSEILGHETSEVSAMLATTPENVWGMVHRARKSLQSAMASERTGS